MLAAISRTPEFALSEDESKRMASAAADVAKHYNIAATEKQMAWLNLAMCGGSIYGPKFFAAKSRMRDEANSRKKPVSPAAPESQIVPSIFMPVDGSVQ